MLRSGLYCEQCAIQVLPSTTHCPGCGGPSATSEFCAKCGIQGPIFQGVTSAFEYGGVVADTVAGLKFRRATDVARRLAATCILPNGVDWDVLIPVPLHPSRLRARGYNQSALLAHYIGRRHRLVVDVVSLQRVRATPPQRGLSEIARRSNVHGAFKVTEAAQRHGGLVGRRILLIDDVMTTGATLAACARALRSVQPAAVGAWVVAHRSQPTV